MIEHQAAYEAAIARNIRINAAKTRSRQFLSIAEGRRANDFLFQMGEFEAPNAVVKASLGDFYYSMRDNVMTWGGLTDGQLKAVTKMIERGEARVAERAAAKAAYAEKAGWIGTVGERRDFELDVKHVVVLEGLYGTSYLHIMTAADGNTVIYKGTKRYEGAIKVKATIKAYDVRDGVKQTVIARPA